MRLGISNIAWDVTEDETVAALLARFGIDVIDIAPGKYFPNIPAATPERMREVREWWRARGIEITGMQALLFGTQGLNLFGNAEVQQRMLDHLTHVCRIGEGLGATRLTFGSPKNRDRTGLTDDEADRTACEFFQRLGIIAAQHGVTICLEPNPAAYGCNFMTTTPETMRMVQKINHPNIRLQLDTGAIAMNDEDFGTMMRDAAPLIHHIHLSELNLLPLGDGGTPHAEIALLLAEILPNHIATIEMVATKDEPHHVSITRALEAAQRYYRAAESAAC